MADLSRARKRILYSIVALGVVDVAALIYLAMPLRAGSAISAPDNGRAPLIGSFSNCSLVTVIALAPLDLGTGMARCGSLGQRAIAIASSTLGPAHADVGTFKGNLAEAYRLLGRLPRSEALYKEAMSILERVRGGRGADVGRGGRWDW